MNIIQEQNFFIKELKEWVKIRNYAYIHKRVSTLV